ncbi:MAG: hypothetical protein ABIF77_22310 [bacterium]
MSIKTLEVLEQLDSDEIQHIIDTLLYTPGEEFDKKQLQAWEAELNQLLVQMPDNAELMACLAICLALGRRKFISAEKVAKRCIQRAEYQACGYFALGRVYLLGSRRRKAFQNFATARSLAGKDYRILNVIDALDARRPAVIPFLARSHQLNHTMGKVRNYLEVGRRMEWIAGGILLVTAWIIYLLLSS